MSLFSRQRTTPLVPGTQVPQTLGEWAALSMQTQIPKPTGSMALDEWNSAVVAVQAYLNGRAVGAASDEEKAYLLRLRADLNVLHLGEPDEGPEGADPPTSSVA